MSMFVSIFYSGGIWTLAKLALQSWQNKDYILLDLIFLLFQQF
jgi:hypothetical protein